MVRHPYNAATPPDRPRLRLQWRPLGDVRGDKGPASVGPERRTLHGKVERRILTLKDMSSRVFHEMQVVALTAPVLLFHVWLRHATASAAATASAPRNGCLATVHLPGSAVDIHDPCLDADIPEGSAFWHRLRLHCEASFHQAKTSAILRRAVLHQTRPQPGPFKTGSWIHCWRSRGGKRAAMSRWHGPTRVLGRDEFGYWVIYNGVAILCSPNCMRFSSRGEISAAFWTSVESNIMSQLFLPMLQPLSTTTSPCRNTAFPLRCAAFPRKTTSPRPRSRWAPSHHRQVTNPRPRTKRLMKQLNNPTMRRYPMTTTMMSGSPVVCSCPRPGKCSSVPPVDGVKQYKPFA